MSDSNKTIIARLQNRRGLKQDLPQPLRAGEIGFTIDTHQVYIGADTEDPATDSFNSTSVFENTLQAITYTQNLSDNNLISFSVPYKRYQRGHFNGVSKQVSWLPTSQSGLRTGLTGLAYSTCNTVFRSEITNSGIVKNIVSNSAFKPEDPRDLGGMVVLKNSVALTGTSNTTLAITDDYRFTASTSNAAAHVLDFRVAPAVTDEIVVCYNGREAVLKALSGQYNGVPLDSVDYFYTGNTAVKHFYADMGIPSYLHLNPDLVTVSATTGTGLIGLEHRHIAVSAVGDVYVTLENLGNLLVSNNQDDLTGIDANVTSSTIVFTSVPAGFLSAPDADYFSNVSGYNYVYVVDPAESHYVHGKVFQVSDANVTAQAITVQLPVRDAYTARNVSVNYSAYDSTGNITLVGDVHGVQVNDYLYVIDLNSGSNINGNSYVVSAVGSGSATLDLNGDEISPDSGNAYYLSYINRGNTQTQLQFVLESHGFANVSNVVFTASSNSSVVPTGTWALDPRQTSSTFMIATSNILVANVNVAVKAEIANVGNLTISPVRSIDLSQANTVSLLMATISEISDWPELTLVPDTDDQFIISHKPAYTSDTGGMTFRLHDDPDSSTLSDLGFTAGEYSRDTTLKARLEQWLNRMVESSDISLFNNVGTGALYTSNSALVDNFVDCALSYDEVLRELDFYNRTQARDFNQTINRIYLSRSNPDIRGLLNLKTNIEIMTRRSPTEYGVSTIGYTEFNELEIPAVSIGAPSNVVIPVDDTITSALSLSDYNTFYVDYTITERPQETEQGKYYHRVGTMMISVRQDFQGANGDILYKDIASEMTDTIQSSNVDVTGSLVINANIEVNPNDSTKKFVSLQFENHLSPTMPLVMKYLVRRWNSGPIRNV